MTDRRLSAVVLAAGEGARMRSTRPKPLHLLCGRAMVLYVLDALPARLLDRAVVVVVATAPSGSPRSCSRGRPALSLEFVEQAVQRGTGDAVAVWPHRPSADDEDDDGDVLVLPGDTPLLRPATLPPSSPPTGTPAPPCTCSPRS